MLVAIGKPTSIYELAGILAAVYFEAERSRVYFGLHANIPVRDTSQDHLNDYGVITFYDILTRIPSQLKEPEHP